MPSVHHILAHTPPWVFLVLAYLLWQGVQSLRSRTLPLWRVLIIPALFIVSGVARIVGGQSDGVAALLPWGIALIAFLPIAVLTGPRLLHIDRQNGEVTRPGSPVPLMRNALVFALQFTIAVMDKSQVQGSHQAVLAAHVISGATAGYFVGWVALALLHYFRSPDTVAIEPREA